MSQETPAEKMIREAKERKQAAEAAALAQKKADDTAAVDPRVAESKRLQDEAEALADLQARQANAAEMMKGLAAGVPGVTPNATGNPIPQVAVQAPQAAELQLASAINPKNADGWRTFQHLYANANTIMPNGKKLIFGGQNGHTGQYSTNVPDQIEHLAELAHTPGSMITEVRKDPEGRYIVVTDAILQAEQLAALADSRKNSARDLDPAASQAMNNLPFTIAQTS